MRKKIIKKTGIVAALIALTILATGCNRTYEAEFEYNADEYIELGQYKNLEIELDTEAIAETLVDEQIASQIEKYKTYSVINRAAQEGDQVVITFYGKIGGKTVEAFSNTDYSYVVGSNASVIEGFDEALLGMKAGDFKIETLKVSDSFTEDEQYTGATIVYEITCKSVKAPIYPQITDTWVKDTLGYETADAYRAAVRKEIQGSIDEEIYNRKAELVMTKAQELATVKKEPEEIIASKREELKKGFQYYALYYGQTVEEYCETYFKMPFEDYVRRSAIQQLLVQAVAQKEQITIDEYYYKEHLSDFAYKYAGTSDATALVEEYGKDYIITNMIIEKATNLIIDSAIIK